jgi:pyruvate/2-oxoglutarate dehydrogenase complex dihydrolipoamide acyltransferase (E2) component
MAIEIRVPRLGWNMEEGVFVEWLKADGDAVRKGEPLLEVETDKITSEVASPAAGILLRAVEPDVEVPVGEPIAIVGDPAEDVSSIALFASEATS